MIYPEINISHSNRDKNDLLGTSLVVQWLKLSAPTAGGMGSILGWRTKIPQCHMVQPKEKKKTFLYKTKRRHYRRKRGVKR